MQKILIANRGEIALRIIRTCREMGIESVAIYSDADADMPFVKSADHAFRIGEPPVQKSYLNADEILRIARIEKVDAIHPGYGFLSENAEFARRVIAEGFTFIGPSPETIEKMGDKIIARTTMEAAGVPVVPGSPSGLKSLEEAITFAAEIGFPIMLKASGGGGGIGMVLCEDEQSLTRNYDSTRGRAKAYFGSDEVFVEKYIRDARHIEVQVFGDLHGNCVHLFERDCSIQRRHQKVIEEAPSPFLSDAARKRLYDTAVKAARAVNYVNAGTVEFIVDEHENFYFLEMNTRLQVEHPVTELITGLDLVNWQIAVAAGEKLPLAQENIRKNGYGIEFRLYAEDPVNFLPSPGKIAEFSWAEGKGIRVDAGYESGSTVTPYYDPMIAKCIVYGETRAQAIQAAQEFFRSLKITGIKSNAPLFAEIVEEEGFKAGRYTTAYLTGRKMASK